VADDVLNRYSEYRMTLVPHRRGDYTFRVRKPADVDHAAGSSRQVVVSVT